MAIVQQSFTTGVPALDRVLCDLLPGDNVVWQVENIEDYARFVGPFAANARRQGRKLVYFRFARHRPLLEADDQTEVVQLDPQAGFETFLDGIRSVAERAGPGAAHVFDSLSDLTADWYCDQMVGNFFLLTCPYLYDLDTVAYFALLKDFHSSYAMTPISETTQLMLDIYRHRGEIFIQALKVQGRSSPSMFKLHVWDEDDVQPVIDSSTIAEVLWSSPRSALGLAGYQLGVWTRTFVEADALLTLMRRGEASEEAVQAMFHRLLRMAISRDRRVLELAERYMDLEDLVTIGKRMLGTGLIGGKSVGMLLARAILRKTDSRWEQLLEVHDSFYIPSDVFYTFLVRNGCWEIRKRQLQATDYGKGADEARLRILQGTFPQHIEKRFMDMLDYFGQSPIIVRSSSLLEDNFGNSFAGKYDSVFCANQGSREERVDAFMRAVKTVYASTMSKPALSYRARHGLLDRDEQMALLVQRVSGGEHGPYYYPQIAGVGFSFNPYVWNEDIDPKAGMIRLVFGLGTRAVDRADDDYTRLVALNAPDRRPEENTGDAPQYAQHKVDLLDLQKNRLNTVGFDDIEANADGLPLDLFASRDPVMARRARTQGIRTQVPRLLTFDALLKKTSFLDDTREMLATIHEAYDNPVDVEFTANFTSDASYKINLVQCRPLQVKGGAILAEAAVEIPQDAILLETAGPVIGQSRLDPIDRIIYVVPSVYGQLPVSERHGIARLIGRLNRLQQENDTECTTMLLGPGRWGTTTPSLGVPVTFAEINMVSVLCEIVAMRDDLVPDVSFGTHFFSELVEMDMLYLALFPNQEQNYLNKDFFEKGPNKLGKLLPEEGRYASIVRVIDTADLEHMNTVMIRADVLKQHAQCYLDTSDSSHS